MKRREFIVGLLGTSLWPSAVSSQPRVPTVGILLAGNRDPAPLLAIFKDEMQRLGYVEGQNIRIDLRSAQGKAEALPRLATELVESKVDVIFAWLTPAVRAAKRATTQIPIVMAGAGDPVATGLVASLVRPGGNITGMAGITELIGKNVELIRELLPSARKLAALCNATNSYTKPFLEQIEAACSKTGFELLTVMISGPDDLEPSFSHQPRCGGRRPGSAQSSHQTRRRTGHGRAFAGGVTAGGFHQRWRIAVVRGAQFRSVSASHTVCRQDSERRAPRRSADTTTDPVRSEDQPADCKGHRAFDPARSARPFG